MRDQILVHTTTGEWFPLPLHRITLLARSTTPPPRLYIWLDSEAKPAYAVEGEAARALCRDLDEALPHVARVRFRFVDELNLN